MNEVVDGELVMYTAETRYELEDLFFSIKKIKKSSFFFKMRV